MGAAGSGAPWPDPLPYRPEGRHRVKRGGVRLRRDGCGGRMQEGGRVQRSGVPSLGARAGAAALTGGCGRESWRRRSGVWALVVMMAAAGRALTAGSMVALAGSSRVGGVAGACGDGSRLVNPCSRGWQRHGSGLGLVARGTMWWSGNVRSAGGLCGFG